MAGPRTEQNGRIVKTDDAKAKVPELVLMLESRASAIAQALPQHLTADRMMRIVTTALSTTPQLLQCTPASFIGAVLQSSQLGLEVNTPLGHAYLIPYNDRKRGKVICQLVLGYQGMVELARRSGMLKAIYAFSVYPDDHFEWELGLDPKLVHKPSGHVNRTAQPLTHVYAVAKLTAGEPIFTVLTRAEVELYRGRSSAQNSPAWINDYDAMAQKTAIRRLYRWLPKSAEMARAAVIDEVLERGGQTQLSVVDDAVMQGLRNAGIEASDLPIPTDDYDPQTGEVNTPAPEPGAGDAP